MEVKIIESEDGSHTLYVPSMNETYHSLHGSIRESRHVFIEAGLNFIDTDQKINILEVGMGTGLNVLLTCLEAKKRGYAVEYHTLEPFPLGNNIVSQLNYFKRLEEEQAEGIFHKIHAAGWEEPLQLSTEFTLLKYRKKLEDFHTDVLFDLVYYDAFAPGKQPEMWQKSQLENAAKWMAEESILVSYCASGQFRRDLQELGFEWDNLPGPPGKKEMTRAVKV